MVHRYDQEYLSQYAHRLLLMTINKWFNNPNNQNVKPYFSIKMYPWKNKKDLEDIRLDNLKQIHNRITKKCLDKKINTNDSGNTHNQNKKQNGKRRRTTIIKSHEENSEFQENIYEILSIEEVVLPEIPEEFAIDIIDINKTIMDENEKLEVNLIEMNEVINNERFFWKMLILKIETFCNEIDKMVNDWNSLTVSEINQKILEYDLAREQEDMIIKKNEEAQLRKEEEQKKVFENKK